MCGKCAIELKLLTASVEQARGIDYLCRASCQRASSSLSSSLILTQAVAVYVVAGAATGARDGLDETE